MFFNEHPKPPSRAEELTTLLAQARKLKARMLKAMFDVGTIQTLAHLIAQGEQWHGKIVNHAPIHIFALDAFLQSLQEFLQRNTKLATSCTGGRHAVRF